MSSYFLYVWMIVTCRSCSLRICSGATSSRPGMNDSHDSSVRGRGSSKKDTFCTVDVSRTYTDDAGNYRDAHTFSGSEPLQVALISQRAYDRIEGYRSAQSLP